MGEIADEFGKLLIKLHRMIKLGQSNSKEADDLRDEMDLFWYKMSDEEQAASRKMSGDLNKSTNIEGI